MTIPLQVALGNCHTSTTADFLQQALENESMNAKSDSTKIIGRQRPDPNYDATLNSGKSKQYNRQLQ